MKLWLSLFLFLIILFTQISFAQFSKVSSLPKDTLFGGNDTFLMQKDTVGIKVWRQVRVGDLAKAFSLPITFNQFGSSEYSGFVNLTAMQQAIASFGGNDGELLFSAGVDTIRSITVPQNIKLTFQRGAMIYVAANDTIKIAGAVEAGIYQIFSGPGIVIFASGSTQTMVYPEWWGGQPSALSSVNRKAISRAVNSLAQIKTGTVYFNGSASNIYNIDSTIALKTGLIMDGFATIKQDTGLYSPSFYICRDSNITIRNLTIDGASSGWLNSSAKATVRIDTLGSNITFDNIKFRNFKVNAIRIVGSGNDAAYKDYINNIKVNSCLFYCDSGIYSQALYFGGAENITVSSCSFYNVQYAGIELSGGYNKNANITNNRFWMGKKGLFCIEAFGVINNATIDNNTSYCADTGGGISVHIINSHITNNKILNGVNGTMETLELVSNNSIIDGNIVDNGSLVLKDATISTTSAYSGIRRAYDTVLCNNNMIINNTVIRRGTNSLVFKIYCRESSNPPYDSISGNIIVNNRFISSTNDGQACVMLGGYGWSKLTKLIFRDNSIVTDSSKFLSSTAGIWLYAPFGSHDLDISANHVNGYGIGIRVDTSVYANTLISYNDLINATIKILCTRPVWTISDYNNYKTTFNANTTDLSNSTLTSVKPGHIPSIDAGYLFHQSHLYMSTDSTIDSVNAIHMNGYQPQIYFNGYSSSSLYLDVAGNHSAFLLASPTTGSVGSASDVDFLIKRNNVVHWYLGSYYNTFYNSLYPGTDGTQDLGNSSKRLAHVWSNSYVEGSLAGHLVRYFGTLNPEPAYVSSTSGGSPTVELNTCVITLGDGSTLTVYVKP
jgi:hypothetical protein